MARTWLVCCPRAAPKRPSGRRSRNRVCGRIGSGGDDAGHAICWQRVAQKKSGPPVVACASAPSRIIWSRTFVAHTCRNPNPHRKSVGPPCPFLLRSSASSLASPPQGCILLWPLVSPSPPKPTPRHHAAPGASQHARPLHVAAHLHPCCSCALLSFSAPASPRLDSLPPAPSARRAPQHDHQ